MTLNLNIPYFVLLAVGLVLFYIPETTLAGYYVTTITVGIVLAFFNFVTVVMVIMTIMAMAGSNKVSMTRHNGGWFAWLTGVVCAALFVYLPLELVQASNNMLLWGAWSIGSAVAVSGAGLFASKA